MMSVVGVDGGVVGGGGVGGGGVVGGDVVGAGVGVGGLLLELMADGVVVVVRVGDCRW